GSSYPVILLQLLIEGLKHIQGRVEVVVNSKDITLIRSYLKDKDINIETCDVISVNSDDRIKGGIEIISEDNSVSILNTVWSRLEKVREDVMPEIGDILFG
ncbi:MAG: V-type ATP synthase subunit E family protein, partial [Nitrospirota bacterium]